ncbi:uncharacterized protein LOC144549284 [Carex rostrata]
MFVITMGIAELTASGLGVLKSLGATVVLKSPWSTLQFITVVTLLLEGIRILCRSHGLELHHIHHRQQLRPLICFISSLFYWLHLISVLISCVLSIMGLASQDFGKNEEALVFFYVVAILEALVFLAAKAIWKWKVSSCRLFEKVIDECGLDKSDMDSIKRFFYDKYSKCMTGSFFDALKMDLITFAEECIVSSSGKEQLMGARILKALSIHPHLSDKALRKIGTSTVVIQRLIQMLHWNKFIEEEIKYSAAVILSELADKEQNAFRVAGIPGAMESISSLLYLCSTTQGRKYSPLDFNLLGLSILMKLAKEHDNCMKICNTNGLLDHIIDFTRIYRGINPEAVIRSLQVVNMLARMMDKTGLVFRQKISEVVSISSNIMDILRYEGYHLQRPALEVLTNLVMDGEVREQIGRTDGMAEELLKLFFLSGMTDDHDMLRKEAGKALAMLLLQNKANCSIILNHKRIMKRLMVALEDPVLSVSSAWILHNLCAFAGPEWSSHTTYIMHTTFFFVLNQVLNAIMEDKKGVESLEVSLGLIAQMLKFTSSHKLTNELRTTCVSDDDLVNKLVEILRVYWASSLKAPQIRQFAIELIVGIMKINKRKYVKLFKDAGIARELNRMTTSELESFNIFFRSFGLRNHQVSLRLTP